jgi:hypothetical protein
MLGDNNLFQHATVASSAYASMAAFTAAANVYNSFYPPINTDPVNYLGCTGKKSYISVYYYTKFLHVRNETRTT